MTHSVNADPEFCLGTFSIAGGPTFAGLVVGDQVVAVSALQELCERLECPLAPTDDLYALLQSWPSNWVALKAAHRAISDDMVEASEARSRLISIGELKTHAPLDRPRQVFCTGANYFKHVVDLLVAAGPGDTPETQGMSPEELRAYAENVMLERKATGSPYMFSKPAGCIAGPQDTVLISPHTQKADWELELAVVIGKPARHVSRTEALSYVAGYTIANDLTNRDQIWRRDDMKAMGTDWIAGKSSPTYLPMGPYLVPADFVPDPQDLRLTLKLNGEVKQDESTSDMIFDVARQIEYLSSLVQLYPGDIICTGSPAGNGAHYNRFLRDGDVMESSITGLGTQRNQCQREGGK